MTHSSKPTILIVDDSLDHQELLRMILEGEGYRVASAYNGKEALEVLLNNDQRFCMILLDLMMPLMDGPTFRKNQLENEKISAIPVIIMTASIHSASELKNISYTEFIKKPIDIDHLLTLTQKYQCA
jgi:two-component system, chemotaxis family, chemotaxis protein CheY